MSPINLLSTTSNSNDTWTPGLDRPQADSYGHFLSTLNLSRILPSDYHDVSANRTRHSYATHSIMVDRDSEEFSLLRVHASPRLPVRFSAMDFLHSQLVKLQKHLAFVQVDPINWKGCVQGFPGTSPSSKHTSFANIRSTTKPNHPQFSLPISRMMNSKNLKHMGRIRQSSRYFGNCSSSFLILLWFIVGFMLGLGVQLVSS